VIEGRKSSCGNEEDFLRDVVAVELAAGQMTGDAAYEGHMAPEPNYRRVDASDSTNGQPEPTIRSTSGA
jgi:hypothetical protein